MSSLKNAAWYGFGAGNYMKHPTPRIDGVFYVTDAARGGDDTNNGLTVRTPVLTIGQAIVLANALPAGPERDVYIFVARTTLGSEAFPIVIDRAYTHIIGTPDQGFPTPTIRPDAGNHGFELAAGGLEIAGFNFQGMAGETEACIYAADAQQVSNHIHHNYFAWDWVAYDCIQLANQQQNMRINNNYFGAHGFTNYAIIESVASGRMLIEDNVILVKGREESGVGGILLHPVSGPAVIKNNTFSVPDTGAGQAIELTGGQDCLISGNVASEGKVALGNIPWVDAVATNHWGLNYSNLLGSTPV